MKFIMYGDIPGCLETGESYFDFRLENCFEDMEIALESHTYSSSL
jgi:hypothetical protein